MSQHAALLKYLRAGGSLTPLQALEQFGCLALSQRMGELRREGYPIVSEIIRLSNGKRVAQYRLMEVERETS
jgi:hypothetical protein